MQTKDKAAFERLFPCLQMKALTNSWLLALSFWLLSYHEDIFELATVTYYLFIKARLSYNATSRLVRLTMRHLGSPPYNATSRLVRLTTRHLGSSALQCDS